MVTTKVFRNTSAEAVTVLGVGEIPAGEQVSVTSEYHQPVILANYPGVIDVSDESGDTNELPAQAAQEQLPAQGEGVNL